MNRFATIAVIVGAALAAAVPLEVGAQAAPPPAAAPAAAAPAGDPVKGSKLVAMCQGCHGIPGWRTAYPEVYKVPKIAGQHPTYLIAALKEYRNGERNHPSMRAIAAQLSDADMANLAAYYAQSALATAVR